MGFSLQLFLLTALCFFSDTGSIGTNDEATRRAAACNSSSPSYGACINNLCNRSSGQKVKRLRGEATHQNTSVSEAFDAIYSKKTWGDVGGGSGDGSKDACGVTAREVIRQILFKYHATSVLDAPCGGVHSSWTRQTILRIKQEIPCFQYYGVDVVESVIAKNKAALAQHDEWAQFMVADLSSSKTRLPLGYDIILSRDALQHLSYNAIAGAMRAYCATNSRYLLVGSYLGSETNRLINVGETFAINLLLPPFNFPAPIETFQENLCYTDTTPPVVQPVKSLLLYNLASLCSQPELKAFLKLAS
jgi:hypothetical protein